MAAVSEHSVLQSAKENIRDAKNYLISRGAPEAVLSVSSFELPVIDLELSFSSNIEDRRHVAKQIHDACTNIGFFYITNHNVPLSVCDATLEQAVRFFRELSAEQKESLHMRNSTLHRGYEPADFTSLDGHAETKEGFNWGYEDALDPTGGDGLYLDLDGQTRKGNQWPDENDLPGFYESIKQYYGHILQLARHLFRLFAMGLNLPEDHFDSMMTHPGGVARLLHYPAAAADSDKQNVGLGAHSDYECFTILLCSSTPGLEILSPENQWISARAIPGFFIVNVADFLMRWTNGLYQSTVHRVVNRTPIERYSIPFFFTINYDCVVETLPTCVTADNPSRYPPIKAGQYVLDRLNDVVTEGVYTSDVNRIG